MLWLCHRPEVCLASLHRHNFCVEEKHWVVCCVYMQLCLLVVSLNAAVSTQIQTLNSKISVSYLDNIYVTLAPFIIGRMIVFTKYSFCMGFSKFFAVYSVVRFFAQANSLVQQDLEYILLASFPLNYIGSTERGDSIYIYFFVILLFYIRLWLSLIHIQMCIRDSFYLTA